MNIVLVSRSLTKLRETASEIESTFDVKTLIIDVDFTSGPEIFEKIKSSLKGKEIGVLVNNVGMAIETADKFLNIPGREKRIQDIINCNVTSMAMMCSIVLPQMVLRKRGVIINISSMSATFPTPELTIYSASKSFMNKFSQDLAIEYKNEGIIVQTIIAGPVACTNMSKVRTSTIWVPKAKDFVESAIKTVGIADFTTGYWPHSIFQVLSRLSNFWTPRIFIAVQLKVNEFYRNREIRKRGYKSETMENLEDL